MPGSVTKRGRTWTVRYDRGPDPETGDRRQASRGGFRTRKEAEAELTRLLRERDLGTDLDPTRLTVGEYLTHWLESDARHRVRPTTATNYRRIIQRDLAPTLGALPLTKLQPAHVSALHARLRERGLAASTIGLAHAVLRAALRQAVRWQLVPRNVCDAVAPPRATRTEQTAWDTATAARFQALVVDDPDAALWLTALKTGLRRGELLALRWADLDLDAGRLTVRRTFVPTSGGGLVEQPPKGGRPRVLDLAPTHVTLLREHRRRQLAQRLAVGSAWQDHDLVFCLPPGGDPTHDPGGRPYSLTTFGQRWRLLVARLGLPPIRPHDLRHTNATLLLEAGVHPKVVQERLGHASVTLTLDRYSHVTPTLGQAAARLLDTRLAESPTADEEADAR